MEWFLIVKASILLIMIMSGGSVNDSALVKTVVHDKCTGPVTHQSSNRSFLPDLADNTSSAALIISPNILLEDEEALIVQHALIRSIKTVQTSIRVMSTIIRICADTAAGVVGGLIKSLGGLFNLLAAVFWQFSFHLHQFRSDSVFLHSSGHRFSKALNGTARVLKGVGESCLWGGEIAEGLTSGLGEALQDSFRRLEVLPFAAQQLVGFLLQQRARYIQGGARRAQGYTAAGSGLFGASPSAVAAAAAAPGGNYTQGEVDEVIRQQNSKYRHHHHRQSSMQRSVEQPGWNYNVATAGSKSHLPPASVGRQASATEFMRPADLTAGASAAAAAEDEVPPRDGEADRHERGSGNASLTWVQVALIAVDRAWARVLALDASVLAQVAAPLHSSAEAPSVGPYLLLALLLVSIVNLAEYPSVRARVATLLACVALIWLCVLQVEHSQRLRIVQRTTVRTLHAHLMAQTHSSDNINSSSSSSSGSSRATLFAESTPPFEAAGWVNVAMAAMWNVDRAGGLRAYYSHMCEQLVAEELARVRPGAMVSVRLKRFDLGTSAPMVKGLRVAARRDQECLRHLLATSEAGRENANGGGDSSGAAGHYLRGLLWHLSGEESGTQDSPPPFTTGGHGDGHGDGEGNGSSGGGGGDLADRFSAHCDSVALDADVVFASAGMRIELSLRSGDSRSVLPDVTVSLSEVLLEGQLRAEMRLTPDFPFIGTTNVSFLSAPSLDFTVSSFGGSVELSAIPLAFSWMNASMHAALSQYTAPMYATVDARHIICPACDSATLPSAQEVLRDALRALTERVRGAARWAQKLLSREAGMVRQSGARVASAYHRTKASVRRLAIRLEAADEFQSLVRATDALATRVRVFWTKLRTDLAADVDKMLKAAASRSTQFNSSSLNNATDSERRTSPAPRRDSELRNKIGPASSEQSVGPPTLVSSVRRIAARALDAVREVAADVALEDLLHF